MSRKQLLRPILADRRSRAGQSEPEMDANIFSHTNKGVGVVKTLSGLACGPEMLLHTQKSEFNTKSPLRMCAVETRAD